MVDEIASTAPDFTQTPAMRAEVLKMVTTLRNHVLATKGLMPRDNKENAAAPSRLASQQQHQVAAKPAIKEAAATAYGHQHQAPASINTQRRGVLSSSSSVNTGAASAAVTTPVRGSAAAGGPSSTATAAAAANALRSAAASIPTAAGTGTAPANGVAPAPSASAAVSVDPEAKALVTSIGDLQKVGPAALQAAKAKMDILFEAVRLKPGDEGYVYDRRVEFAEPRETSDWDD